MKFQLLNALLFLLLSLAPQPGLGLGLLHKIRLNFLEASQQFSFYRVGLLAPRPTPIPEDQASVFISPRGRVATHFSRLLQHAWVTVGLFLFPGHYTGVLNALYDGIFHRTECFKHNLYKMERGPVHIKSHNINIILPERNAFHFTKEV
jgi:hypothetical protein